MATLLIIDDDRSVRHLVTAAFRDQDVDILSASTAREGLDLGGDHQDAERTTHQPHLS